MTLKVTFYVDIDKEKPEATMNFIEELAEFKEASREVNIAGMVFKFLDRDADTKQ